MMKSKLNFVLGIALSLFVIVLIILLYLLSPVSSEDKDVSFIVTEGESLNEIAHDLKEEGLIKNEKFFVAYLVLKDAKEIYAARYDLNTNMKLSQVVDILKNGGHNADEISITFKEGLNMRQIAKLIEEETNNSYEEVLALNYNNAYLNELIGKYSFITKNIKNKDLYYPLEGYLFPDTYNFTSKSVSVKEIFNVMLDNFDKHIKKYEKSIKSSGYSVNQIVIMASIVELEGIDKNSRKDIAGVFYNRIDNKMSLGSDVTSYYGVKKDMTSDITQSELDDNNPYNTRLSSMAGKLPVGPICNPSEVSIEAALKPSKHDYLYFVADKNGKVYLTKNYETHNKVIADLKNKGLWFEW